MLMRDAGEQLGAVLDRDTRYWEEALPLYAELQIDVAGDARALRQTGRRGGPEPELVEGG